MSRVNEDLHGKFLNFTCKYLCAPMCDHTWKNEVIVERYRRTRPLSFYEVSAIRANVHYGAIYVLEFCLWILESYSGAILQIR